LFFHGWYFTAGSRKNGQKSVFWGIFERFKVFFNMRQASLHPKLKGQFVSQGFVLAEAGPNVLGCLTE